MILNNLIFLQTLTVFWYYIDSSVEITKKTCEFGKINGGDSYRKIELKK